ncbi:hypothetical protein B989_02484 [Brucella sp. 56/94]|nr:hypothetical protein DK65_2965 [Brucella pinnipedialis]ENR12118.1 hypothetical protein C066_02848 [Brucella sp. UK5/01]ENS99749.1 hypothetical protein B989_02484 [Brucella sp. 56/94]ENT13285.1 hypothetical protein C067_02802 [Brucella sp. F8/99]ENT20392.1 hypothetical protein C051_02805 [Brucella sp. UK40/99]KFJ58064.1 hypothetical protein DK64_168 [Brucella neotomae 5K33]
MAIEIKTKHIADDIDRQQESRCRHRRNDECHERHRQGADRWQAAFGKPDQKCCNDSNRQKQGRMFDHLAGSNWFMASPAKA